MTDPILSHVYFDVANVPITVRAHAYNLFLGEELKRGLAVRELAPTDSNALKVIKRCLHYEVCLLICGLDENMISVDGMEDDALDVLADDYKLAKRGTRPDVLTLGLPIKFDGDLQIPEYNGRYLNDNPDDPRFKINDGSYYTIEVFTTRGNVQERINDKEVKGNDYIFGVDWRRRDARIDFPIGYEDEFCCIYTDYQRTRQGVFESITSRVQQYQMLFNQIDLRQENIMNNAELTTPPVVIFPTYFEDDCHQAKGGLPNQYDEDLMTTEITDEDFIRIMADCVAVSPELTALEVKDIQDVVQFEHEPRETYMHSPFPIQSPAIEIRDPYDLLEDLTFGRIVRDGMHYGIKMNPLPKGMAARDYVDSFARILKTKKYIVEENKKGTQRNIDQQQVLGYKVVEMPKDYCTGRGLGAKLDKTMANDDLKQGEMKESNIGEALFYRTICRLEPPLERSYVYPVIERSARHHIDDEYKAHCLKEEARQSSDPLCVRLHAISAAAKMMLSSVGRFKEKKNDKTVKGLLAPVMFGDDPKICYGFIITPNSHIKNSHQKAFPTTFFFASGDKYVGAEDYTVCEINSKILQKLGLNFCYIKTYPTSRPKMYDGVMAVRAPIAGMSDFGDIYLRGKEIGLVPSYERAIQGIQARIGWHAVNILLDTNALQGRSSACTKLGFQTSAINDGGLEGLILEGDDWYKDTLIEPLGAAGEFQTIAYSNYCIARGEDQSNAYNGMWSFDRNAVVEAIVSEDLDLDTAGFVHGAGIIKGSKNKDMPVIDEDNYSDEEVEL